MIKNEQLKEWGWKLEKKNKSNKILRDKIEKKKKEEQIKKRIKNNNQMKEYHIWYKTKWKWMKFFLKKFQDKQRPINKMTTIEIRNK
jgi:hypothetical protein